MALYEHVFISRQDLSNAQAEGLIEHFGTILSDNGGKVVGTEYWGLKTMAYKVNKNRKGHYCGGRKQSTVWEIDKPRKSETGHSTQKPVECMKRPIENNSSPGQAVYEPFSGSGTTIIAGEMTGRAIYAMELSPAYVDVAVKRWQDFTGEQAKLEGSGDIFPSIKENVA